MSALAKIRARRSQLTPTPGGEAMAPHPSNPYVPLEPNQPTQPIEPYRPPTCSECKAPAALTKAPHGMLCAYCNHETDPGIGRHPFLDADCAQHTDDHPRMVEPRNRLAAIEQKRPRVTRDSVELAKLHPWECDE